MAVQVSYPGVYIEEFAPGAPIEGVGTSTAAFIGIASKGVPDRPTKIASWDQFVAQFGELPVSGFFLWYTVRGFFENGGQICYIVRASNGERGHQDLMNRSATPKKLGTILTRVPSDDVMKFTVTDVTPRLSADVFKISSAYAAGAAKPLEVKLTTLADAANFRPGDLVTVSTASPDARILRIVGDTLYFDAPLTVAAGAGTVRLANLPAGSRVLRIVQPTPVPPPDVLVPGAVLSILKAATVLDTLIVESVQLEPLTPVKPTYRITFRGGLAVPLDLTAAMKVRSEEISVEVDQAGVKTTYVNLSIDPAHPRYYVDRINNSSGPVTIQLEEPAPAAPLLENLPKDPSAATFKGTKEELATLDHKPFLRALDALRSVDDVNLIAVPDCIQLAGASTVQTSVISHCELLADRFAVLDAAPKLGPLSTELETQRAGLDSTRGYAGFYYPWLRVPSAVSGPLVLVPPSGHVCGIIARSDNTRGVHKAPANEIVNGALGVEFTMSDAEQGQLNLYKNINVIRVFQAGGRPVLNGARTTATDRNWQYVNIRRLFLYLEESIQEGIRWAVFEPNNLGLWEKLRRSITEFLLRTWRDGALFGATPKEAFYVRIDEALNPPADRALGRLTIEIGVKPSYPAEFIIVRIGIWQGGSDVSEA
jgi:uncharacterized protein